jgi:hypothetical protein
MASREINLLCKFKRGEFENKNLNDIIIMYAGKIYTSTCSLALFIIRWIGEN